MEATTEMMASFEMMADEILDRIGLRPRHLYQVVDLGKFLRELAWQVECGNVEEWYNDGMEVYDG